MEPSVGSTPSRVIGTVATTTGGSGAGAGDARMVAPLYCLAPGVGTTALSALPPVLVTTMPTRSAAERHSDKVL
jgi:hypothetical protein